MITNLLDFQLNKVLESLVQLDDQVIEMLHKIEHPISNDIISMIDNNKFIDTESDLKDITVIHLIYQIF
jgi:DNA-directed RNA polymerase subunit L